MSIHGLRRELDDLEREIGIAGGKITKDNNGYKMM